jgi:hypothetical protein
MIPECLLSAMRRSLPWKGSLIRCSLMRRPIGVTIIAILFLARAVYLWISAASLLLAPHTVSPFTARMLRQALRLIGPYAGLGVGVCYAFVGWGLFRLHNWARIAAMLVMGVSAAFMLPALASAAIGLRWSAILMGLQIVLCAVIAFYLLSPKCIDIFVQQSRE